MSIFKYCDKLILKGLKVVPKGTTFKLRKHESSNNFPWDSWSKICGC